MVAIAYDVKNKVYLLCFAIMGEETNNNWSWFLDLLHQYVIEGQTRFCIIPDRHLTIKISMEHIFPKPIWYHQYFLWHFVSNFNTKLKNISLKNMLHKKCVRPSKQEFDILYEKLVKTNDAIRVWLDVEPKEKRANILWLWWSSLWQDDKLIGGF